MERDFKGVWIPKEVWLDERLTALEKVIFVEIDSLDTEDLHCYASNKHLADFCQCTEVKISTAINKLIKMGYLEMVSFDGRHRILKSRLKETLRQTYKNYKTDLKKVYANNIVNNTDINEEKKEIKERKNIYDSILDERGITGKKRDAVLEYIKMRKFIKKPMTDHALELALNNLNKLANSDEEQIAILEQSISNSWQGLFPLKKAEIVSNNEKHNVAHKPSEYKDFDIKEYYKGLKQ